MTTPIGKSVWQGTFHILGIPMHVHVLDNGQRVIEADSVEAFIAALGGETPPTESDLTDLASFVHGRGIPTFLNKVAE